jgi:hypothetical protein
MRANPRQPEFMYHGGGRRVVDHTKDELHTTAPSASILMIITDTLKFRGQPKMKDNDDDEDDSYLELDPHEADHIPEEDQHLFMPRVADPELDTEYRKEVDDHDRRDRLWHVCGNPSRYHPLRRLTISRSLPAQLGTPYVRSMVVDRRSCLHSHRKLGVRKRNVLLCVRTLIRDSTSATNFVLPGFIAFTTVGYGDLYPKTPAGRAIFVFWALLGVAGVSVLIAVRSVDPKSCVATNHDFQTGRCGGVRRRFQHCCLVRCI